LTERVRLIVEQGVGHVTLCDAANRNAFGLALAQDLNHAVTSASNDPKVRVILLDAEGPYFSVGGDLLEMRDAGDAVEETVAAIARAVNAALLTLADGNLPVISAWSGTAAGGGVGFALCGDMVIAGQSARLKPGFTQSGLTPDTGLTWLLPRVLGHARAFEILAFNPQIEAARALDLGLVNQVVADDTLATEAMQLALRLASIPAEALIGTKHLLRSAMASRFAHHLDKEAQSIAALAGTADTRERLKLFFVR
jgi:2-(1,2-epoxy-1,2-dihydrophenyl)acetyl-CoA isomerase